MKTVAATYVDREIPLVEDNLGTHFTPEVRDWLGRQFEHHFPSHTGRGVVDAPDWDLVGLDHSPSGPPWHIQLGQTARRHDQELHRQLEHQL